MWTMDAIENGSQSVRRGADEPAMKFLFTTSEVKMIELGHDFVLGAGPSCPFIVIKEIRRQEGEPSAGHGELYYRLPNAARGIE